MTDKRTTNTSFRSTKSEKEELRAAADSMELSLTDWILWASDHLLSSNPTRADFLRWQLERETREIKLDTPPGAGKSHPDPEPYRHRLQEIALEYLLRANGYTGAITPEIRDISRQKLDAHGRSEILDKILENLTQPPQKSTRSTPSGGSFSSTAAQ